jgi:hypothetical protein
LLEDVEKKSNMPMQKGFQPARISADLQESLLLGLNKPRPAVWLPEPQTYIWSEVPLGRESQCRFSSEELEGKGLQCHLAWEKIKVYNKPRTRFLLLDDCHKFGSEIGGKQKFFIKQDCLSCIHRAME